MSVLVCYDGSVDAQEAIRRAATVAGDGRATVLTVWEPFSSVLARTGAEVHFSGYEHLREIDTASEENADARAADGVARAREAGSSPSRSPLLRPRPSPRRSSGRPTGSMPRRS